ncbi:PaaI family thioesterase [Limnohabitans sp. Hippo4]|uniref:PaaI family thioesterase n=1 Tax=Limnohabitans sp. Hippo4 TaxID=1826167 RepID=UPI000D385917|nr:PaaI family thioesterase [Limnohabitans sp. Hippo4]PUE37257.1 phenylacetic acid degradation protein [Limnohabitans sp. Hippo4]
MSIPFGVHIPFVDNLGFTLEKFENGTSELHYSPRAEHHNSFAITHGGAVMTLLDVVMATAARSVEQEMGVVTIEMKTSFMRPAKTTGDEHLVAKGLLLHRTKTMAFTDGKVYDADGQLCAHATGTFKYVKRTPSVSSPISTD